MNTAINLFTVVYEQINVIELCFKHNMRQITQISYSSYVYDIANIAI